MALGSAQFQSVLKYAGLGKGREMGWAEKGVLRRNTRFIIVF